MCKLKYLAVMALCVSMVSCDSNKGKVEDFARQFISAVSTNDKIAINEMYPSVRTYKVLHLVDSIESKNIEVEYNPTDSIYVAKLNDSQSLVIRVNGENELTIMDSYNILKLDDGAYELAVATSAPVKKQSDLLNGELFSYDVDESYSFIAYLSNTHSAAMQGNLFEHDTFYSWGRKDGNYEVKFETPVTNYGQKKVSANDYSIEIAYMLRSTGQLCGVSVVDGVDLAPGETHIFTTIKEELYKYAAEKNLSWKVYYRFKNLSTAGVLAKYGDFSGNEYEEYLAWKEDALSDDSSDE